MSKTQISRIRRPHVHQGRGHGVGGFGETRKDVELSHADTKLSKAEEVPTLDYGQ